MRRGVQYVPPQQGDAADPNASPLEPVASVKPPILIRVPRGYAVLAAAGVVLVVVLAYWVGHTRGYRAAERDLTVSEAPVTPAVVLPPASSNNAIPSGSPATSAVSTTSDVTPKVDPRREGLNYYILAHYPLTEAQRLARFLREGGVEAYAIPVQNKGLAQVVAGRGFTAQEIGSPAANEYRDRLRALGKQWQARQKGANDLSDMYLDRFGR